MLKLSYMLQLRAQSFYPSCYKYCQRWIKDIIIIRYLHHMLVHGFIQALKRVFCKFSSSIKTKWFKTTATEPCFVNPLLDIWKLNKMLFLDFGILLQGHHYISDNLSQQAKGTIFWLFSCSLQLSFQKQIFDRLSLAAQVVLPFYLKG